MYSNALSSTAFEIRAALVPFDPAMQDQWLESNNIKAEVELSNNAVERMAKSYAVVQKFSLFHTYIAGANTCATLYAS